MPLQPPKFPRRLARKTAYESDWVKLYLDRVVFPNGRVIAEYHLIQTKNAVAALVENEAGELLFERSYRYATDRLEWEIPAGGIEAEEDILDCAKREVREETGYDTTGHRLIYRYNPSNGNITTTFHLVACQAGVRVGEIDPGEIESIRWMKRGEIEDLIRQGELQDGYTLSAVLLWFWIQGQGLTLADWRSSTMETHENAEGE